MNTSSYAAGSKQAISDFTKTSSPLRTLPAAALIGGLTGGAVGYPTGAFSEEIRHRVNNGWDSRGRNVDAQGKHDWSGDFKDLGAVTGISVGGGTAVGTLVGALSRKGFRQSARSLLQKAQAAAKPAPVTPPSKAVVDLEEITPSAVARLRAAIKPKNSNVSDVKPGGEVFGRGRVSKPPTSKEGPGASVRSEPEVALISAGAGLAAGGLGSHTYLNETRPDRAGSDNVLDSLIRKM